jgi:lysozyme
MEVKGIDVSTWQGDIDWKKVASGETKFAILRATFGTDGVDRKFVQNITNAPKEGIFCGAYHYCYATTTQAALEEADHFLQVIKPYQFPYPVALDLEDAALTFLGKKTLTDIAQTFLERVRDAGYYVCLYSNLNWMVNLLDMSRLESFDVWLAQWNSKPTYQGEFGLWQYSSEGELDGIPARVDLDLSYRDYPSIIQAAGQNGFPDQGGQPDPEPDPKPDPDETYYTVKAGDTMSGIASKFGVSLDALLKANPQVTNPNVIYAGQVLRVPDKSSGGGGPAPDPKPEPQKYTVKSNDTLSGIAKRFGVSLSDLLAANPQIKNPNIIYPGQVLTIPGKGTVSAPAPQPKKYTVKSGDTLSGIAKKNNVTLDALRKANPQIKNPNVIYPGQVLVIPS